MTLDDVSTATHGERSEHYRRTMGLYDLPMQDRPPLAALADQMATAEMLNEIHAMLRSLTAGR